MGKLSLNLQKKSLQEMLDRKPYQKKLAGLTYFVLPKVYKGSTDTELFCKVLKIKKGQSAWDIGTGTGLIALTAKKKGAGYVLATDLNPASLNNAKQNSKLLKLKIDVKRADVFGNIKRKFDLITFNPPFTDQLAKEPHHISFWDSEHISVQNFFRGLEPHLKPNGQALIAWSSFGNVNTLRRLAGKYNYSLEEIARKKGKRNFIYYIFRITN